MYRSGRDKQLCYSLGCATITIVMSNKVLAVGQG